MKVTFPCRSPETSFQKFYPSLRCLYIFLFNSAECLSSFFKACLVVFHVSKMPTIISQPRPVDFQPPLAGGVQRSEELCGVCSTIAFHHNFYHKITQNIRLGTWEEILQSQHCPFCRLVASALIANPNRSPRYLDDQIILSNTIPRCRLPPCCLR
jgi:hypothetical protein